jgi:hypothetical protein
MYNTVIFFHILTKYLMFTDYMNAPRRHTCNTRKFPQTRTAQKPQQLGLCHTLSILKNCMYLRILMFYYISYFNNLFL